MGLSRRQLLLMGGGAAAVAAIPTAQHIAWGVKDYTRPGYDPNLPAAAEGETAWMNWSGIERATPKQMFVPGSEDELAEFVKASSGRIRPVGSGHSFTGLSPSEGAMVDVSRISGLVSHDAVAATVTFGAGTRLRQAAQQMAEIGLAWPNQPDIDIQTLAGSFATGTHGTGRDLKAMHDQIVAFRLVTAAGDILDVNRETFPELFGAGKVSLGALGIVTQYTLRMVPSYNLRRIVWVEKVDSMIEKAPELARTHRNFEFYYFPGTGHAAGISHDVHDGAVSGRGDSEDDTLLADLRGVRDLIGWAPWIRRKLMEGSLPKGVVEDVTDESWRLLSTTRPIKFNEMEYHLPEENGIQGIRDTVKFFDGLKEAFFPIEFRWTGQDDALLSPFNSGTKVSVATHAGVDERYDYFFDGIEPMHRAKGGKPHWGKLHSLGRADLEALYPGFGDFLRIRRELDPSGKFLNPHLAQLFGEDFND